MATANNFILNSSGDFGTAGNWSLGHVPENTEDADINSTGGVAVDTEVEFVNSIGTISGDGVVVSGGQLTAYDGTGPNANDGSISIVDGFLFLGNGTFDNVGTVALEGVDTSDVGTLDVEGSITLDGGGNIAAAITPTGRPDDNILGGFNFSTTPTLVNQDDTISGDLTIGGLNFTNDGSIDTNNDSSSSGGEIAIQGSAGGGSFTNASGGGIFINSEGVLVLGENNVASTIDNEGSIFFQADLQFTTLDVTGSVTISASGGGRIEMFGETPSDNQIDDLGETTQLNLVNQTLDGAGTIGIGDNTLTLNLESGTIEADLENQVILINTGSNTITNDGTLRAVEGGDLVIDSPIANNGTISVFSTSGTHSIVELNGPVTGFGPIDIGTSGELQLKAAVAGNYDFTGPNATIVLGTGGNIVGPIANFGQSDSLDLQTVTFASGLQASWQQNGSSGTLSLLNGGGSTLASFTLTGQYSTSEFAVVNDGSGGTSIEVTGNPPPPSGTSAAMIMTELNTGGYEIYDLGNNAILANYPLGQVGIAWQFIGLGDFDGADTSDMILQDGDTGALEVYDISNNLITSAASLGQVGLNWIAVGFGDFSGNADETDMMMRNSSTGNFEEYDIRNNVITTATNIGAVGLNWQVAGFGDLSTNPNETDMLLRNASTGAFEFYDIVNGQLATAGSMGVVGNEWQVAGFGDFSSNPGETDMMMRNVNTGTFELYDIRGNAIVAASAIGAVGLEWQVAGFGPIDGAGTSDMVLRNVNTGAFEVYDIANNQLTTAAGMGSAGLDWQVDGFAADPPGLSGASNAQIVQAMASMGGDAAVSVAIGPTAGVELSQPTVLTTPHPA